MEFADNNNFCPYGIQILNYGQNADSNIGDDISNKNFSQLYCTAPEQIIKNKHMK